MKKMEPFFTPPVPAEIETYIGKALENGLAQGNGSAALFFRADDIGVPSQHFSQMINVFRKHRMPLCLAAVPSWLTSRRLHQLRQITGNSTGFCWHQHGWLHKNHEPSGKKQEFGESRPLEKIEKDLLRGKDRLEQLLGKSSFPLFTPPWNRCGATTLQLLADHGFSGVSRSRGATPSSPDCLPDIQVNVDLHTRKESDAAVSLGNLLKEMQLSIAGGTCGIMLHHQLMDDQAYIFLEKLLQAVSQFSNIFPVHFEDLVRR